MAQINPRPGVVVALTDRRGEIACYDPNAYKRRDYLRNQKIREAESEEERHAKGKTAHGKRKDRRSVASAGQRVCRSV